MLWGLLALLGLSALLGRLERRVLLALLLRSKDRPDQ